MNNTDWILGLLGIAVVTITAIFGLTSGNNTPIQMDQLAGMGIESQVGFVHQDLFVEGAPLFVALDINRYDDKAVGQDFHVYIVNHIKVGELSDELPLIDVRGNSKATMQLCSLGLSLQTSMHSIDGFSALTVPDGKDYLHLDVVFDFNKNGLFDYDTDVIDRVGVVELPDAEEGGGLTLVKSPDKGKYIGKKQSYFDNASDRYAHNVTLTPPVLRSECAIWEQVSFTAGMSGEIYYPDVIDEGTGGQQFPLVLIAHGNHDNSNSYQGFENLGKFLASHGYICVSVNWLADIQPCTNGSSRTCIPFYKPTFKRTGHLALLIGKHLEFLLDKSTSPAFIRNKIRPAIDPNSIALIGHSRGGDAALLAHYLSQNYPSVFPYSIKAVCQLAPTDGAITINGDMINRCSDFDDFDFEDLPNLLIAVDKDSDVVYGDGFRVLDRSKRPKHAILMREGLHKSFNEKLSPLPKSVAVRAMTKYYVYYFFNTYLRKEQWYLSVFTGFPLVEKIEFLKKEIPVAHTYGPKGFQGDAGEVARLGIDAFENPSGHPPNQNDLDGNNVSVRIMDYKEEELFRWLPHSRTCTMVDVSNYYVHYTQGARIEWLTNPEITIPPTVLYNFSTPKNILNYQYLNFRVVQTHREEVNCQRNVPGSLKNLQLTITDDQGTTSKVVRTQDFHFRSVYYPQDLDMTFGNFATKVIMQSVVIPVRAFTSPTGKVLDLRNINRVSFRFSDTVASTGEIVIDDLEFVGLDLQARPFVNPSSIFTPTPTSGSELSDDP